MNEWKTLYAYRLEVEPLIAMVIQPFLDAKRKDLECSFWQRHYVGGNHVRIRMKGDTETIGSLIELLRSELVDWMNRNPQSGLQDYNPERALSLLRLEGVDPKSEDLTFRSEEVVERRYPDPGIQLASGGAQSLLEKFREARGTLACRIMECTESRREIALGLYFALAAYLGRGELSIGSVSYKSHWCGFAACCPSDLLLERIESNYHQNKATILTIARDPGDSSFGHERQELIKQWGAVVNDFAARASLILERGDSLTVQPQTAIEVSEMRAEIFAKHIRDPGPFTKILWEDERFLAVSQHDISFQLPRALVNLLYDLIAALGFNAIEKMTMCHHAFRAAEETSGVELEDILRKNVTSVIERSQIVVPEQDH